jgi:hypothetical protein
VLYHGPVRVPSDARPGDALIRFELPADSGYTSVPTEVSVRLVEAGQK